MLKLLHKLEGAVPYKRLRERINRRLADFLGPVVAGNSAPGAGRVLEAACGSAYAAHLLAKEQSVRLSVGLDRDLRLFEQGGVVDLRTVLVIGDLFNPPFHPGSFDLVWNSSSVEEVDDPAAAVKSMAVMTRPGGHVFVGVSHVLGPLGIYHLIPFRGVREWLGRPFSRRRLRAIMEMNGLAVEREITYFTGFFIGMLARKCEGENVKSTRSES